MTELKTLKDITRFSREGHGDEKKWWLKCVNADELRQEAIKQVKFIRGMEGYRKNIEIKPTAENIGKFILKAETDIVERWIMHFFNLTEEELK